MKYHRILFLTLISIFLFNTIYANAGLPMIVVVWPIFLIAFIPIVIIEWKVIKTVPINCSSNRMLLTIAASNAVSTLIGIPITWGIMLLIQCIIPGGFGAFPGIGDFWRYFLGTTVQAPWLLPYDSELYWMIPSAFIVLLIPFFFASYWIESWVNFLLIRKFNNSFSMTKKATWKANLYSYGFLLISSTLYLLYQICVHHQLFYT